MPESRDARWSAFFTDLEAFVAQHGHARVPRGFVAESGRALGVWVKRQRSARRAGTLPEPQAAALESVGFAWDPPHGQSITAARAAGRTGGRWAEAVDEVAAFAAQRGHANVPRTFVSGSGRNLGLWLRSQREAYRAGRLTPERVAALEAVGVDWNPPKGAPKGAPRGASRGEGGARSVRRKQTQAAAWDAACAEVEAFAAKHGHARVPRKHVSGSGRALGRWLVAQRSARRAGTLPTERVAALEALGVDWDPPRGPAPGKDPERSRGASATFDERWAVGFAELAEYVRTRGHANVPRDHVSGSGQRLGEWVRSQRRARRAGRLAADRVAALEAVGFDWGPGRGWSVERSGRGWATAVARLAAFKAEFGHANPVQRYAAPDGFRLGAWLTAQRGRVRRGALAADRKRELVDLGVCFDDARVQALGDASPARAASGRERSARTWERALASARAHVEQGGSLNDLSGAAKGPAGAALGRYVARALRLREQGALDPGVAGEWERLGLVWVSGAEHRAQRQRDQVRAKAETQFVKTMQALAAYRAEHGHAVVHTDYQTGSGYWLGRAIYALRVKGSQGVLPAHQRAALEAAGVPVPAPGQSLPDSARVAGWTGAPVPRGR